MCNPNDTDASCATGGLTMPIWSTGDLSAEPSPGGVVYRGPTVRLLSQYYIYGDVGSGICHSSGCSMAVPWRPGT